MYSTFPKLLLLAAVFTLVASACATSRPTVQQWQPTWDRAVAGIPEQSVVGENPPRPLCDSTLVFLREIRPDLSPTPDLALDDTVRDWIDIAEDAFFECPPASQRIGSFAQAYALMARLQAEVDIVLELDRGS